ncbi:MAG TPA: hypothetical protein VIL24_05685 [Clostridia bacterium]
MRKRVSSLLIVAALVLGFGIFAKAYSVKAQPVDYNLTSSEIVASTMQNIETYGSSKSVDIGVVEYSVKYGLIDGDIQEFTKLYTNGFGSVETYGLSNYTCAHLRGDFVRVSKNYHLIFTFEIKQDVKLVISNPQCKLNSDSRKLIVTTYQSDGENRIVVKSGQVPAANSTTTIQANELGAELHAKAGDMVTYVIGSVNYDGLSFDQGNPILTFSFLGTQYSEEDRYDFEALKEYKAQVAEMCDRIQAYYDNLNQDDYTFDNQLELIDILETAINQAQNLTLGDSIEEFEASVYKKFQNVLTIAQQAQILQDKKDEALEELSALFKKYSFWDYSFKNWKKIQQIIAEAEADIKDANAVGKVTVALSNAKAALEEIKKGGNLLWLYISLGVVIVAAGVVIPIVILKKKKS